MKTARSKYTTLQQICNLIPAHLVPKLSREFGVEDKTRSFSAWSHVLAMLFSQLSHSLSLNDIADSCHNHSGVLNSIRRATPPSRNGLSYANMHRNSDMMKELFWVTRAKTNMQYEVMGQQEVKGSVIRDATMRFTNINSQDRYPGKVRLIKAIVEVDGKEREMEFITNNFKWAAASVCDLYKSRWGMNVPTQEGLHAKSPSSFRHQFRDFNP